MSVRTAFIDITAFNQAMGLRVWDTKRARRRAKTRFYCGNRDVVAEFFDERGLRVWSTKRATPYHFASTQPSLRLPKDGAFVDDCGAAQRTAFSITRSTFLS